MTEKKTTNILAAIMLLIALTTLSACNGPTKSDSTDSNINKEKLLAVSDLGASSSTAGAASGAVNSPDDAAGSAASMQNNAEPAQSTQPTTPAEDGVYAFEDDGATIDPDYLASLMGEDQAAKLVQGAQTNRGRYWIASHPDALALDGDVVQTKLLNLAADDDEAVPFVFHFAESYPAEAPEGDATCRTGDDGRVPRLYQWDRRWGYTVYSSTAFGLTGCGPTAFAMAYQGVTGKRDVSPYDMGVVAQDTGQMARFEGTSTSFMGIAADYFGIKCWTIPINSDELADALNNGAVVIANMDVGYFSHFSGHYLVLTGYDDEGRLVLNDPYSAANSHEHWDVDFILSQSKGLYVIAQE